MNDTDHTPVARMSPASTQLLSQLPERRTAEGTNVIQLDIRPELFRALDPVGEQVTGVKSWRLGLDAISRNVAHQALAATLSDSSLVDSFTLSGWFRAGSPTGQLLQLTSHQAQNGTASVALVMVSGQLNLAFNFGFPNVEDKQDMLVRADQPVDLPMGTWHRLTVVIETGRVSLFVDGARASSLEFDPGNVLGGPSFRNGIVTVLGGYPMLGEAGSELISFEATDVRAWNHALSEGAVSHDRARAGNEPGDEAPVGLGRHAPRTTRMEAHWESALEPALYLIEHYQMDIVPAATGLGKIAKTITLLPGERTTTFISSVREVEVSSEARRSVLDSTSEETQQSFDNEVRSSYQRERSTVTDTTVAASTSYEASASASGTWGWGSANVSSTVSGSVSASQSVATARKDVANAVRASTAKTAKTANARRDLQIETNERTTSTERDVESIERHFHNPSPSRTMTAVFRQINQRYVSFLQLVDVRIGYSEGAGIALENSLTNLDEMLRSVLIDGEAGGQDDVANIVRAYILDQYGAIEQPAVIDGVVSVEMADGPFLVEVDGGLARNGSTGGMALIETGSVIDLAGALVGVDATVMRTDNVAAESVLGESEVFDPHARDLQAAQLAELKLRNQLLRARLKAVRDGPLPWEAVVALLSDDADEDALIALERTDGPER